MISSLLLNRFYPVMSYRRVRKERRATNYRVRFGHSLWSANRLPAQGVVKEESRGDELITKRHKCVVCRKHNWKKGPRTTNARNVT